MTTTRRLLAVLLRGMLGSLLRDGTAVVDIVVYAGAVGWLLSFAFLPDAAFAHIPGSPLLAIKGVWVWPALLAAIVTPLGWVAPWPRAHRLARSYQVGYWLFMAVALALVAPTFVRFWLSAAVNVLAVLWLMAREGADELPPASVPGDVRQP